METELKRLKIDREARQTSTTNPMWKIGIYGLLIALLAAGVMFAVSSLGRGVPVQTALVQPPIVADAAGDETILVATGYIIAAHKIEVASKVVGRVSVINVDKGDRVKAGQVLVRLEDDEYRAQVTQQQGNIANLQAKLAELEHGSRPEEIEKARADVAEAKADLANTQLTYKRTKQLVSEGVLSRQSLDDAQGKLDGQQAKVDSLQRTLDLAVLGPRHEQIEQVRAQIEQARGALAYAQTQLDNTIIRAPVAGTILDRNVEKGEFVTNGFVGDKGAKGYLVTMADLDYLQVELDISQNDFPKLGPRQRGIVTTDAYPDRKYQGYVEQVAPEADRAKATVQVKVRVENPDSYLRPDMNATVTFVNPLTSKGGNGSQHFIVLPETAVQNGSAFVVQSGVARKRTVVVAGVTHRGLLIASGLSGGENIVLNAPPTLKDGSRVEPRR